MTDLDDVLLSDEQVKAILQSSYPLPGGKTKPLKVAGKELDSVLLVPKGYSAPGGQQMADNEEEEDKEEEEEEDEDEESQEDKQKQQAAHPDEDEDEDDDEDEEESKKPTKMRRKYAALKEENQDLKQKLVNATNLAKQLEGRLEEIEKAERTQLANQILDIKIENDLLSEDDREKSLESLIKLGADQLSTLLSEVRALLQGIAEPVKAKPKTQLSATDKERMEASTPTKLQLSVEERKAAKVREKLFGHSEPIKEYLAQLSENDEDYGQGE